jgi:MoxR-like ATPase
MTIDEIQASFAKHGYLADRDLATVLHLSLVLNRPLLLEGEAGVGKTEVARVLAKSLDAPAHPPPVL